MDMDWIAYRTAVDAIEAADDPQYRYMYIPGTNEIARYGDGSPMIELIPVSNRIAANLKYRLEWVLKLQARAFAVAVLLFIPYVIIQVEAPPDVAYYAKVLWLGIAIAIVFTGIPLLVIWLAWQGCLLLKFAFKPMKKRL